MLVKRLIFSVLVIFAAFYLAACGGGSKSGGTGSNSISVSVTSSSTTVDGTNTVTLSAVVANDKNGAGVSWSVSGGGTVSGTTSSATYTAPAASSSALTVTVTGTSIADNTKSAKATITVPAAPAISTSSIAAGKVGTAFAATLAATGGIPPYTWAISNGTLPAGLAMDATGAISGTPMAGGAGTSNLTFKVTDSGKSTALTATADLGITVAAAPAITFGSASLADGAINTAYAGTVSATGGAGPLTYSLAAGAFPDGVTMSAAGAISGTPSKGGSFSATVKASDAFGDSATQVYPLKIALSSLSISAVTLPTGYVGSNFTQTSLAATGGSGAGFVWTVSSGSSLPDGIALSSAGVLSGKPTAATTTTFGVTVTDSAQNTASAQLSMTVKPGISLLTPSALPTASLGSAYSVQLTATGGSGTGYTWIFVSSAAVRANARRMAVSGGLPDGLNLSSDGLITGTPTTPGNSTATLTVTDSAGNTATVTVSFTIVGGITITTPLTLPGGQTSDFYSQTLAATGGSGTGYTWAVTSGLLPGGLQLSSDGVLSGSLPAANTYTFGVTVTDSILNTASATFSLTVTNNVRFVTTSLVTTYMGLNSQQSFQAKGGSGHGYVFTLGAGSTLPDGFTLSAAGVLSGKASAAGTFDFSVTVTDSASNTATGNFSLTINAGVTITSPTTLPGGTVGSPYLQNLIATGGSGSGYIWTVTSGANSLSGVGLSLSRSGVLSGTPPAIGTATFSVSVTDSSVTYGTATFTVAVDVAGAVFPLSGNVTLGTQCGSGSVPAITITINTSPVQTTTTDSSGNFSFASVPNGSYTLTPSITGASSIFYPASMPITVSGAAISSLNFTSSLGYKVSGTVGYSGTETGQIYIWLLNKNCGGNPLGTSISAPGSFTIEGVPPGTYTLGAGIDSLGFGYQNDVDAAGVAASDVTITDADATGTSITLTDPNQSALPVVGPVINAITPNAGGAVVNFQAITGSNTVFNQIELADTYAVQFTQDPTFAVINQTLYFKAGGSNGTGVLILNDSHLASGNTYYFRMAAQATVQNVAHNTHWTIYSTDGVNPTPVTIGEPAGNLVSGTVTFGATPTGPLYVGFYDMKSGAVYATRIASPVSPQPYSLNVPTGTSYFHFAILDQNNDGMIDRGDISNTHNDNATPKGISAATSGMDLTLNTPSSKATVTTQHVKSNNEDGSTTETYILNFNVREGNLLTVSVRLVSGPHIINPIDLGKCLDCGNVQFQYNVGTYLDLPAVGDSYDLLVTYSDGTSEHLTALVTGVMNAFATALDPSGTSSTSLTPTFTWTDPANPGNYQYQFYLNDNQGNMVWQLPGNNSQSNGFSSSITSITWGTDPTGGNSTPTGALTHGTTYYWQIQVMDANGNSTQERTFYKP